jgi:hypothetical protein
VPWGQERLGGQSVVGGQEEIDRRGAKTLSQDVHELGAQELGAKSRSKDAQLRGPDSHRQRGRVDGRVGEREGGSCGSSVSSPCRSGREGGTEEGRGQEQGAELQSSKSRKLKDRETGREGGGGQGEEGGSVTKIAQARTRGGPGSGRLKVGADYARGDPTKTPRHSGRRVLHVGGGVWGGRGGGQRRAAFLKMGRWT